MIKFENKTISSIYGGEKTINKVLKGTLLIYDGWKKLIASGIPPLTIYSKGEDLLDYKIYGNSVQNGTPSIENPIDVQSVGDKTVNLFDEDLLLEGGLYEKVDGGYRSKSYAIQWTSTSNMLKHLKSILKPDVKYTISRVTSGVPVSGAVGGRIQINMPSGNKVICTHGNGLKSGTFALTQEQIDSITDLYVYGGTSAGPVTHEYIQLEEGDEATEHEIYNKCKIPIKIRSFNRFDISEINSSLVTINGEKNYFDVTGYSVTTNITPSEFLKMTGLKTGDTFTASVKMEILKGESMVNSPITFLTKSSSKSIAVMPNGKTINTVTIPDDFTDDNYYGLYTYGPRYADENNERMMRYSNFMIVKGEYTEETLPKYEPYIEPVITKIYLDEPLRKTGNYADYIDFANKKVVRNVYLDYIENMTFGASETATTNGLYYRILITNGGMARGTNIEGYSNILPSNVELWTKWTQEQFHFGQVNDKIYLLTKTSFGTGQDKKDAICNYLSNNGVNKPYIIYPISTPIEEEIELPNIPTNKGTNIIEIDTTIKPSNVEVSYMGK